MRGYSCPICGSANCSIFGVRKPSRLASSPYDQSLSETAKERPGGARERREGRAHHARPGGVRARAGIRPDDGGTAANGPAASRKRGDRVSGEPRRCGGLCDAGHDRGRAARNPGDAHTTRPSSSISCRASWERSRSPGSRPGESGRAGGPSRTFGSAAVTSITSSRGS